ncbi:tRNA dihydrouridine synthase DusB [Mycoplasma yeatsii]|uniref:tRNA-dihydrouridine synthase n=2 Tax=Mycoplasma yeatsii TaxID=51365 RepID=S6G3X6_9MOLU|nr:tRNA dihydrouridine synthase DusB [Mycoplasma yeatsii]EOA07277.1 tRNA-dihydrouridine synthase (NifR3 family) [Mycoplasma yeatsii 13926]MDQ0567749.1 tRNA-dihydrouridine synthase B [Mycoplasma yeatsii]
MKIGNIEIKGKVVQGPMAGVSNEPFRVISKQHGASLVYAEMVSVAGMAHENKKTFSMLQVSKEEHPMSMQIFGNDVEDFINATKWIDENVDCDIIDLNLGCPAPKVAVRSASGSALLKTPELIYEIVKAVVENTKKPVTAKIRLGWDKDSVNAVEVAKLIEKAGASAIAVHGRTRSDFYSGHADWEKIKEVKDAVKIPVIGNGDVVDGPSAKKMLDLTGCDAVMISRACQGNPWIFEQINYYLETGKELEKPSFEEWEKTVLNHADLLIKLRDEQSAMREFRKHLTWYLDVLDKKPILKLLKEKANKIETLKDVVDIIKEYGSE